MRYNWQQALQTPYLTLCKPSNVFRNYDKGVSRLRLMSFYVLKGKVYLSHTILFPTINPSCLPFPFSSTTFLFTLGVSKSPKGWQAMLWGGNLYVSVLIAFSWLHTVICYPHSFPSTPIELHCVGSNNSSLQPSCFSSHGKFFTYRLYTMKYSFCVFLFPKYKKCFWNVIFK